MLLNTRKQIKDYIINSCTRYIMPVEYGDRLYSLIGEIDDEFLCPAKSINIIKKSCAYYGVDYESRRKGTRILINYSRKLPLIIESINQIYAFCTASPNNSKCVWFFLAHIKNYQRVSARETRVIFPDDTSKTFPVSPNTFENQRSKASLLQSVFMQRVDYNKKQLSYMLYGPKVSKASESIEFYLNDPK